MASFALQKFKALQEAGAESAPPPNKRQRGNARGGGAGGAASAGVASASALAQKFESPEVKEARRKKDEEARKIFMEKEKERQVIEFLYDQRAVVMKSFQFFVSFGLHTWVYDIIKFPDFVTRDYGKCKKSAIGVIVTAVISGIISYP